MANIEIERRFLLANDNWRQYAGEAQLLQQGYISVEKECTIRVRIIGENAWLTLKGYISDISRSEYEYPIPLADAQHMMATLCPFVLEKNATASIIRAAALKLMNILAKTRPWLWQKSSWKASRPRLPAPIGWARKSRQTADLPTPI